MFVDGWKYRQRLTVVHVTNTQKREQGYERPWCFLSTGCCQRSINCINQVIPLNQINNCEPLKTSQFEYLVLKPDCGIWSLSFLLFWVFHQTALWLYGLAAFLSFLCRCAYFCAMLLIGWNVTGLRRGAEAYLSLVLFIYSSSLALPAINVTRRKAGGLALAPACSLVSEVTWPMSRRHHATFHVGSVWNWSCSRLPIQAFIIIAFVHFIH